MSIEFKRARPGWAEVLSPDKQNQRPDLEELVRSLDYNELGLLANMAQSELATRNMRARADNGEDGSGW